jgi:hypothetical protein
MDEGDSFDHDYREVQVRLYRLELRGRWRLEWSMRL